MDLVSALGRQEEVPQLSQQTQRCVAAAQAVEEDPCVICFENPRTHLFYPCGHRSICKDCAEAATVTLKECPMCRAPFREVIPVFL